jgi:hypothetical protein
MSRVGSQRGVQVHPEPCDSNSNSRGHSAQAALANTLFHMKVRRSELLELPWV